MSGTERRRLERMALRCDVTVRERRDTWTAETADVGGRGCRIRSARPVARGALLRLRFGRGGDAPLEAVGQVAWTRSAELEAGVAFVSAPPPRATWLDAIAAARLRLAGERRDDAAPAASLAEALLRAVASPLADRELSSAVLRLGAPPRGALPAGELAVARVAAREGTIAEVLARPDGAESAAALLLRGAVTLGRGGGDAAEWRRVLAAGPVLVPPPPDGLGQARRPGAPADARAAEVAALIAEALADPGRPAR